MQTQTVHRPFTRSIAFLFAITCGLAVANIYYAQPLLDSLAVAFGITHSLIGIVITVTQLCYAVGLFLLVPLGDLIPRRPLIIGHMALSVIALVVVGLSPTVYILFGGLAVVGLLAVVTQTLVAYASSLAKPIERGQIVGIVTSGIVIGILFARSLAGWLTDLAGWRSVYLVSAFLMSVMTIILFNILPTDRQVKSSLSYPQLLFSVLQLYKQQRLLQIRGVLAMLIFIVFSILWTSMVLPLSEPPFSLTHTAIGALGLAGIAGTLGAVRAGKLADQGKAQWTTGIALVLLLLSWIPLSWIGHSLYWLILGIVLLDLAVQAVHVTNQSMLFTIMPEARGRLTASYMIFYSIGSAIGSMASTMMYSYAGWSGVCYLGGGVSIIALLFWLVTLKNRLTTSL
ncbi:putative MFS family arabinose efflux permease [Paenibacillus sp. SORGH_AS306]|uniref:MFS transporter n=1 Tax=unclassified Paenibacillus TaxID=185978 RepID=UPI0027806429|nr:MULTISPECIES: MFS transporter [unclassified Paenibacillus]MDQ1233843.1 putative MFS family arabinose efflux permease [Paenibacillus sp. SORGH_AS_0306]MDR6110889.1 putative MFS family arabinose efflux permease [Paenibacillus sp. SORGH_AS_0338]